MIDISLVSMLLGFLLILIPAYFLYHYKTGLTKDLFISAARMTVQLFLVGFYLKYIFLWDKWWINLIWVIIMSFVAGETIISRTKINWKEYLLPISLSLLFTALVICLYFSSVIVLQKNPLTARYFVPISGMMLGNMLSSNVIAMNSFFGAIKRERVDYLFRLANGATQSEALFPYMREAMIKSFNPTIAQMAVMGLISMPGTMTGQILGGADPDVAIKYQIMLMISIFSVSMISVIINLLYIRKKVEL